MNDLTASSYPIVVPLPEAQPVTVSVAKNKRESALLLAVGFEFLPITGPANKTTRRPGVQPTKVHGDTPPAVDRGKPLRCLVAIPNCNVAQCWVPAADVTYAPPFRIAGGGDADE